MSQCALCAGVLLYSQDQCTVALGRCCSADACAWSHRVYRAHCTVCAALHYGYFVCGAALLGAVHCTCGQWAVEALQCTAILPVGRRQWGQGAGQVWCVVVWCGVVWCARLCCAVLCCAVLCCAVLCCAVLCCAVLCCAVLWVVQHSVLWVEMSMTHLLPVQSQQQHWVTANILQSVHPIYNQNVAHRLLQPLNKSRNL